MDASAVARKSYGNPENRGDGSGLPGPSALLLRRGRTSSGGASSASIRGRTLGRGRTALTPTSKTRVCRSTPRQDGSGEPSILFMRGACSGLPGLTPSQDGRLTNVQRRVQELGQSSAELGSKSALGSLHARSMKTQRTSPRGPVWLTIKVRVAMRLLLPQEHAERLEVLAARLAGLCETPSPRDRARWSPEAAQGGACATARVPSPKKSRELRAMF